MFKFNLILYGLEAMTTQIAVNMVKKFNAPVKITSSSLHCTLYFALIQKQCYDLAFMKKKTKVF